MYIAVEGCAHGELDIIYDTIREAENYDKGTGKKIDLLICCGDFQATRNLGDLSCMSVPDKYKEMGSFYKYYSGEKVAPVLTIFIGGNHEASNHLQELSYGGWVAPNIYYLGYAGVVNIGGIRIAGISGIYKGHDYLKGHYEKTPYDNRSIKSVYHIRKLEVFRLKMLTGKIDIFLSHDWPLGITKFGDVESLLKVKPHFREDIENNKLGSPPAMELLEHHRPTYWFSAHMHCKFSALLPGPNPTKFLALDKCLPTRKFLQVIEIDHNSEDMDLKYDLEWLTILYYTNHLLSVKNNFHYMPSNQDSNNDPVHIPEDKELILKKFNGDLKIPKNFVQSAEAFNPNGHGRMENPTSTLNEQTTEFCKILGIDDPLALLKLMDPGPKREEDKNKSKNEDCNFNSDSSFERSFVSDTVLNTSESDCLPVVIDKVSAEHVNKSKPNSLIPLKLPAVSNVAIGEEVNMIEERKEEEEQTREKKQEQTSEEVEEKEVTENIPIMKKFKRRNQSIYADTS